MTAMRSGGRDGLVHRRRRRFGDEVLKADEAAWRIIGVNGGDAAGVARVPGLQKVEAFAAPDFADYDAVRAIAHGGAQQAPQIDGVRGALEHAIGRGALDFGGVLEDQQAFVGELLGDQMNDGVHKRRLAGTRPADDEDVLVVERGFADKLALSGRHRARGDVVVERKDAARPLADAKTRAGHDGRDQTFEAAAVGQLAFEDRRLPRDRGSVDRRQSGHGGLGLMLRHLAEARHRVAETLDPQPPIRIQHDLDDARVSKSADDRIAQFALKLLLDTIGIIRRVTCGGHAGPSEEVERAFAYKRSLSKVNAGDGCARRGVPKTSNGHMASLYFTFELIKDTGSL
jgi:hypothetical protein